ncbi:MAG: alginate lyase family protein, partial [Thermomicrobiales bacterium]
DLANADRICNHVILGQSLGRDIDWRANPIGYLEWMHAFNRHAFMQDLIKAYQVTNNETYAAELDYLVSSWIETTPSPVGNNGGGDPAWETLSTAVRCYNAWFDVFYACRQSPRIRDDTIVDMVKSFYHHAEHLMEYGVTRHNNWLVVESQTIASIGVLFPEFKRAAEWAREGYRRLAAEIVVQIYPDGAQWELSAGYHCMCGQGFASAYELAQLNGVDLQPVYQERLRGMFDHIWRLARPDGSSLSHNDSGSIRGYHQDFVRRGARLFDDPVMEWFGSKGEQGTPPATLSHGFVDAGLLVMRNGWQSDARWALFDAGPFGAAHQHEDALSVEIFADGKLFICDPGISSYMREQWTDHQRDTASHNTIMLDGHSQARRTNETPDQHVRSVRSEIFWATGAVADAGRARYTGGYRDLDGRFIHERAVVFVRPDYWLVFDEVRDEDAGNQRRLVESLFHFTPMRMQIDPEAGRIRTYRQNEPNLELIPLGPASRGPRFQIICGQNDPVQGWISDNRENLPAPCVVMSKRTRLPFRMGLVLYPYATGVSAGVATRRLRTTGEALAYELRHADGSSDLVCYRWADQGDMRFAGYATDGWLAIVRRDAQGQDTAAATAGATYLHRRNRDLDSSGVPVELLQYDGSRSQ